MVTAQTISPELSSALRNTVGGERILWSAQPEAKRQRSAFLIWLFAIPWTLFSFFLAFTASSEATLQLQKISDIVPIVFMIPFILIGLWLLWLPFRVMLKARVTLHALTEKRLVTIELGKIIEVKSLLISQIGPIVRSEGSDGWGTLSIQTHTSLDSEGHRSTQSFSMTGIPDVGKLERLIMELKSPKES